MGVDSAAQAGNAAALAQDTALLNGLILATGRGGMEGLKKAGLLIVNQTKRNLSKHGTGIIYQRGNKTHQTSAPGEAPAVDTGRLRASYTSEAHEAEKYVEVGTNVEYAPFLEYGTSKMDARPHFRPAIEQTRAAIQAAVVAEIVNAEKAAIAAIGGAFRRAI